MHGLLLAICLTAHFSIPAVASAADQDTPVPPGVAPRAVLTEVYAGDAFYEGPTWEPKAGMLYFTAFAGSKTQILRLDRNGKVIVWLDKAEGVNGTYLSTDGRLLGAQVFGHRVVSYAFGKDAATDAKTLAADATWQQPNDLWQAPGGNIYFTDPDFANRKASSVFLLKPDGKVAKVVSTMPAPNGIIGSLDGKTVYISDSYEKLWRSFQVAADGSLDAGKEFFNPKTQDRRDPDGMTIDADGNVYCSGRGGVWVVAPSGKSLGFIPTKVFCSNLTFGGVDGKTLYLTCDKKVYTLQMLVAGAGLATATKPASNGN